MVEFIEVKNITTLANLASEIWHEYWVEILTPEQIDYMVENFQSENAISNQIENENYIYFFINVNGDNAGYIGLSKKQDLLFLSKLYIKRNSDTKVWAQKLLSLLKISQKKIIIKISY